MSRILPICILLLLASAPAAAKESGPYQLERFLDGLVTLRANFEQTVFNASRTQAAESSGTLFLSRPGRFRWTYTRPAGQLIVADGKRVWLYDEELEQVSHRSEADALRGTPALLLSDTAPVTRHFEVEDRGEQRGLAWVELRPRDQDSEVARILLAFGDGQLRELQMSDAFGQETRFVFRNLRRNPKLDSDLFRFRTPPGVDILEN